MTTTRHETQGEVVQAAFREAMSNVSAAVSVVTTLVDGHPHGTTVSAFSSLSMEPPMLLVSLDNTSTLLSHVRVGSSVGVNVLAAHHDEIALHFSRKAPDKFADVPWHIEDGAPALADKHAWVALRIAQLVPAGDHTILLGDVVAAHARDDLPLTYWRRKFGTHRNLQ